MAAHETETHRPIIDTVPAIAGLVYSAAAAVQFLQAEISLGAFNWTFQPSLAVLVSLGSLLVVFASSKTRDWEYYDNVEQAIVGLAIILMLTHQYTETIETAVSNNQPWAGSVAFGLGIVAWGVLAR